MLHPITVSGNNEAIVQFQYGIQKLRGKVSCLKKHHIALWDTLQSCERESSLDSNIKEEEYNDIDDLLSRYPQIKKLYLMERKLPTITKLDCRPV